MREVAHVVKLHAHTQALVWHRHQARPAVCLAGAAAAAAAGCVYVVVWERVRMLL